MQPATSVLNGPAPTNTSLKDTPDTPKVQQNGSASPIPPPTPIQRPPLNRIDSRGSFPYRPAFPNQPGGQQRPPQPPPIRQPQPGQQPPPQFINRPPPPRQPGQQFLPPQQPRANFRPLSPFPRPLAPNQRPPGIFQQRSVPSFGLQRPQLSQEDLLQRSQTLDGSDITTNKPDDKIQTKTSADVKPPMMTMQNRSYSLASNPPDPSTIEAKMEERRQSVGSVESLGEARSRSGSNDYKAPEKPLEEVPSRPESRAMSRMNKILEDDDGNRSVSNRSPSSLTEVTPKSTTADLSSSQNGTGSLSSKTEENLVQAPVVEVKMESPEKKVEKKPEKKLLDLNCPPKAKSPARSEGDNDSGVDESTQGNDQSSNGDSRSPRKSSGKNRTTASTPTNIARSSSRGSKSPSLKSPDSNVTTPGSAEKKKIPMNKVQVGSAPSPNLKVVRSKIGSLENTSYRPGGGKVKIENKKLDFKNAAPRIEAKNDRYVPKGGEKKIQQQKLQWSAKSKIGSLENTTYKPKGGDKKIESIKLDFKEKAKSKVGSKDNIKHTPGGGDIKSEEIVDINKEIENRKIEMKVQSKIGSLDNVKYKPGGGDKKIFDDKEYLKQKTASENQSLTGSQKKKQVTIVDDRPEVKHVLSPQDNNKRFLETVEEERPTSARIVRCNSARSSRKESPRPKWRI